MKTRSIIIAAIAMMAIVPTASAQKKIKEAFDDVFGIPDVSVVGQQSTSNGIDSNGITIESSIVTIYVKGQRPYRTVFDKLKKAFADESKNASSVIIEEGFEGVEMDSATVHDLGLRGHPMNIWREGAESILIGALNYNSSYRIANFEDKNHPGYRTCCAAEWYKTDEEPNLYKAQLVYVYGRKPESMLLGNNVRTTSYPSGDIIRRQLAELGVDTCLAVDVEPITFNPNFTFNTTPKDIPVDGDMASWMNKAMNNVKHLSNSDWHRFFGLLTQQMMDKVNKKSMEDMVVAAGIILDLCKNADQLDDDERHISATRLMDVGKHFDNDQYQYIHDLLMLGAKKLEKK